MGDTPDVSLSRIACSPHRTTLSLKASLSITPVSPDMLVYLTHRICVGIERTINPYSTPMLFLIVLSVKHEYVPNILRMNSWHKILQIENYMYWSSLPENPSIALPFPERHIY